MSWGGKKGFIWPIGAICTYASAYFLFLYHPGLLRYDDFGYVQSVIETWARGRPYTHDWLAPYSATSSTLCALMYWLTGKFMLSTWGLQSVSVLINFILLYKILRSKLISRDAALLSLTLGTFPIYWYKCAEFGGNIFTFTFVLAALLAYQHRRWSWFFIATFLAFANRQNSLALLAIPISHLIFFKEGKPRLIFSSLVVSILSAFILHSQMNTTSAQEHSIYATLDFDLIQGIIKSMGFSIFVALALMSGLQWVLGSRAYLNFKRNLSKPILPSFATAIFILFPLFGSLPLVDFQTPFLGSIDHTHILQYAMILTIPFGLWILDWQTIIWNVHLTLCLALIALTSMRGFWFDIYLVDIGLAVLVYVLSLNKIYGISKPATVFLSILLSIHLGWTYAYKIQLDKGLLSNHVYEGLERENKLDPEKMTDITLGFAGWKLFDYHRQEEAFIAFDGFRRHIRKNQVVLETELPWRRSYKRGLNSEQRIIAEGQAQIGFFQLKYRVADLASTEVESISPFTFIPLKRSRYQKKPLPLNEEEWGQYLKSIPPYVPPSALPQSTPTIP